MTNDEIAEAIADALFVNGLGEQADRLVMKKRDQAHGDLGGWCHAAVRGVAGRVLEQADHANARLESADFQIRPILSVAPRGELVARVAGDVFVRAEFMVYRDSGKRTPEGEASAVEWSVRIARQIVGEVERTEHSAGAGDNRREGRAQ
jgi:hypothetical protein